MTTPNDSAPEIPMQPAAPAEPVGPSVSSTPATSVPAAPDLPAGQADVTAAPAAPDAPAADEAAVVAPVTDPEEEKKRRRRRGLFFLLLSLFGLFILFGGWYLINRKPISELPLPGVTVDQLPHYSFSIYGVTAPTGVAVNADGSRIYATQTEGDPMVIAFDASGKPLAAMKPPPSSGANHLPAYVAVNPTNGDVYASDRPTGKIFVYSPDGGYRRTFDPGAALKGWAPLGLGFDSKGDLFVTSVAGAFQAVHEFGPDGTFIRTFGKADEFNFPNGVAVDAAGNVYITDSDNGRLMVFDPTGNRLAIAKRGASAGDLGLPRGAAIDDDGRVYVADISVHGIQVYRVIATGDRQPKFIGRFGAEGSADGAFEYPNAVAVDGRARIYVADWRNNRIQVWSY